MGSLTWRSAFALAAASLPATAHAAPDRVARWTPFVVEASARFGVPARWIEWVIRAESAGRTTLHGKPIRSRAGAMGLMQLMPATWAEMRDAYGLGPNPDDPRANIMAGTAYLRLMVDRFGYPGLFAAYNAGPGRYAVYLAGKSPLPAETIAYVDGIIGWRQTIVVRVASTPREALFVLRRDLDVAHKIPSDQTVRDAMFAIKREFRDVGWSAL